MSWKCEDNIKVDFIGIDFGTMHLIEVANYMINLHAIVFMMLQP
jgi:hypothetical protein